MKKAARLISTFLLAGCLLVTIAGLAAASDVTTKACWANCGIGGERTN